MMAALVLTAGTLSRNGKGKEPVDYVDPYIGSISHLLVPVYPTVHLPNSMVRAIPMRGEYSDNVICGLPVTITGHRGGSAFSICPWNDGGSLDGRMVYHYDNERISPYRYDVFLDDIQTEVHYAPSHRSAVYSLDFRTPGPHYVVVSPAKGELSAGTDGSVSGFCSLKNDTKVYLYLRAGNDPVSVRTSADGKVILEFAEDDVVLRYGVSFIDTDQAKANLENEVAGKTVDEVARTGRDIWNETLSGIRVKGGTEDGKTVFYTSLYRMYERPVNISEDGRYYSAYDGKVHEDGGRPMYLDDWYWDTFRTAHPLRTIVDPGLEMDMVNSAVTVASQSGNGWIPMFPTVTGDNHSMNCNHGVAVVADCISKGLTDFDADEAYEVCKGVLTEKSFAPWTLMPAQRLDRFYHEHGYYPALPEGAEETEPYIHSFEKRQPVAVTLGTAYDNWCLSRIAAHVGNDKDAGHFADRSYDYRNLFNKETGFFHPKDESGNFIEPFDYCLSGGVGFREYYDENNGWIYRWDVPHNIADLIDLMGGPDRFAAGLDTMFDTPLPAGKYGLWKQSPDHSAVVGHFSMGNEPCMHVPYLYNYAGQPWKTQKMTRTLLDKWFRADLMGIPGDEDGGGLCGFAVFSMMGFYPVTPGLPVYALTSPVFEEVSVDVGNGKTFRIICRNYAPGNKYIQSARLNGEEWDKSWISHEDIMDGAVLELTMGRYPSKEWASAPESCPPSFSMDGDGAGKGTPISEPNPQYADFNYGQTGNEHSEWVQSITVQEPECRSDVSGKVTVRFKAPGMSVANALLWSQPAKKDTSSWGHDVLLTPKKGLKLAEDGSGTFSFNADRFPAGPMNVRIYTGSDDGKKDFFELQLYNTGGERWNQGIPDNDPPGAEGLKLIYTDDFDGPLSISNDGIGARYNAHKPRFGDFSGWQFADVDGPDNPFFQRDTYLKIAARKRPGTNGSSGLIASVNMDGEGFWVKAPCYLECRFTAQSAPGTWPAFWTITGLDRSSNGDELDIIEAYGGVGPGNPNHPGYSICSHFWGQKNPDGTDKEHLDCVVPMMEIGGKSYWSTTFHTYAVRIDLDYTTYYMDNIEVFRHPTNDVSRERPHLFLINYAIGGISGWGIDLERYGNGTDMYVDYVRVYAEEEIEYSIPRPEN